MFQDGMLKFERTEDRAAKIIVVGIGGGGGNAVNRMIDAELKGVEYIAINTDVQDLSASKADIKIQIGDKVTGGLGSGGNPEKGQLSAEESIQEIEAAIKDADMVFITAGMGGGTGTGAAPIVAKLSRDLGILTVGIVTKPFSFEGKKRRDNAELGVSYLKKFVDSLVVVPNDKLLLIASKDTTIDQALLMANEVLKQGVQAITDIISKAGLINRDFADVKTVMSNRGIAHIGIGHGFGDNCVSQAVKGAIESPLLETSIAGAKAVLLNITGGKSLTMLNVSEAADQIEQAADRDAIVIFGTSILEDTDGDDEMIVTVIATGFEEKTIPTAEVTPESVKMAIESAHRKEPVAQAPQAPVQSNYAATSFTDFEEQDDFGFEDFSEPIQESLLPEDDYDSDGGLDFSVPDFLKRD
ncbi:MAG: cell division protein FtsZ [Clostridiales Family XIII bacterium]|jgi:cell division protein FtsZ|nr:cell division protein FtsZ [Clostridiales Family XIII bacterium]